MLRQGKAREETKYDAKENMRRYDITNLAYIIREEAVPDKNIIPGV